MKPRILALAVTLALAAAANAQTTSTTSGTTSPSPTLTANPTTSTSTGALVTPAIRGAATLDASVASSDRSLLDAVVAALSSARPASPPR